MAFLLDTTFRCNRNYNTPVGFLFKGDTQNPAPFCLPPSVTFSVFGRLNEARLSQNLRNLFKSNLIQAHSVPGVPCEVNGFHEVSVSNPCLNDNNETSWRGDWQGGKMEGMLSFHPAGKNPQDFSFISNNLGVQK